MVECTRRPQAHKVSAGVKDHPVFDGVNIEQGSSNDSVQARPAGVVTERKCKVATLIALFTQCSSRFTRAVCLASIMAHHIKHWPRSRLEYAHQCLSVWCRQSSER